MQQPHYKLGRHVRVADHLYRYSTTKKYYAVFKCNGKTKWVPLNTTDRELAGRKLKEEIAKYKKTDPKAGTMTLEALLTLYEQSIQGLAEHTQETRRSILAAFKKTWTHGLDMQVRAVTKGQIRIWLSEQQARLKNSSFNEYVRFVRHLFAIALDHKVIGDSPAADFKQVKMDKPIRPTPNWEQFLAIVEDIRNPKKALDAACQRLKFPHFSSRASRRCFITRAIELGVDFKTISAWQGHQDGGVLIAKTYSHLRNEHSDNMAKKLVA